MQLSATANYKACSETPTACPNRRIQVVVVKYIIISVGKSIPSHGMKSSWVLLFAAWHRMVREAHDARQLMGTVLLLESFIKFDALTLWWKKCYIASYKKVRKLSVTDRLPSLHGAATLMANPTLALVVSRILVLDEAIDYKFKKKKRRGRPSFSVGDGSSTRSGGRKSKKMKRKAGVIVFSFIIPVL